MTMKKRYVWLGVAGVAIAATLIIAATFEVTVPPGNATANAAVECDKIRLRDRVPAADWDNNACANVITRGGLRVETADSAQATRAASISACTSDANNVFQTTMNDFDVDYPCSTAVPSCTQGPPCSVCGDSVVVAEFGELFLR